MDSDLAPVAAEGLVEASVRQPSDQSSHHPSAENAQRVSAPPHERAAAGRDPEAAEETEETSNEAVPDGEAGTVPLAADAGEGARFEAARSEAAGLEGVHESCETAVERHTQALTDAETKPTGDCGNAEATCTGAAAEARGAGAATAPVPPLELACLPPDHPLLRRAQEALHRQLAADKLRLQEQLHERRKALKDAKQRREDVGVELYGFQQRLARLQLSLEQAGDALAAAAAARANADAQLASLRAATGEEEEAVAAREAQIEGLQRELDKLAAALRAVQAHGESVASQVAAAKRQTYATEGAVTALEGAKRGQDLLIDRMQRQLGRLERQAQLAAAAAEAQRAETAAARSFTAMALGDMEGVAFEKKQLLGRWKSSLVALARRDAALEALRGALQQQQEQRAAAAVELEGYGRQLAEQRGRNEQAEEVVERLQAQAARVGSQVERVQRRQAELQESHAAYQQQLAEQQRQLDAGAAEAAKLAAQAAALERQHAKLSAEAAAAAERALSALGEQTFAEKGAQRAVKGIEVARRTVQDREAAAERLRATLDRLGADTEAAAAVGDRAAAVLAGLEGAVADKAAAVAALEAELRAGHADVEGKARQVEVLNRRYQGLLEARQDADMGPLEATAAKLQSELAAGEAAGRDLQRRWIRVQGQLVAAQADGAEREEEVAGMRAQQAVMQQRRARLERGLQSQQRQGQELSKQVAGLRAETTRLNALLADAAGQKDALRDQNVTLESKLATELKALEGRWVALHASLEELRGQRAEAAAAVVEGEREVLVWERRVQLEKEMQDAVDPAHGNAELAAARRQAARLAHAAAALARQREGLVGELERAVEKRELIGTKARLAQSQHVREMTASQARRAAEELAQAAARAQRDARAAEGRLEQLGERVLAAQEAAGTAAEQCAVLQAQQAETAAELEALARERHRALVSTALKQREAKRYEDALDGRYKPAAPAAVAAADVQAAVGAIEAEADKARRKQERLREVVEGLAVAEPAATAHLERALAYAAALEE